ncbi:uncharacterized protein UDID_17690 [Ustilago sp. UG-2017a]|nr:uncharacterized protein UDID_17690 [Ustilago sp. UG-2017a]
MTTSGTKRYPIPYCIGSTQSPIRSVPPDRSSHRLMSPFVPCWIVIFSKCHSPFISQLSSFIILMLAVIYRTFHKNKSCNGIRLRIDDISMIAKNYDTISTKVVSSALD